MYPVALGEYSTILRTDSSCIGVVNILDKVEHVRIKVSIQILGLQHTSIVINTTFYIYLYVSCSDEFIYHVYLCI